MNAAAWLVWAALAPASAPLEDNAHYREARAALANGRVAEAEAALQRAYLEDPRPEYLFIQAELMRAQGRCDEAIEVYRRFIAAQPPAEDIAAAQRSIDACEVPPEPPPPSPEVVATEREPEPAPVPAPEVVARRDPPPPTRPRPWADPLANAFTWPGLAVAGVGAGLLGAAHRTRASAMRAGSDSAYLDELGPAPKMSRAGIALLSVGGAAALVGLIRYAVVARRSRR